MISHSTLNPKCSPTLEHTHLDINSNSEILTCSHCYRFYVPMTVTMVLPSLIIQSHDDYNTQTQLTKMLTRGAWWHSPPNSEIKQLTQRAGFV